MFDHATVVRPRGGLAESPSIRSDTDEELQHGTTRQYVLRRLLFTVLGSIAAIERI